jgi:tripartite-type tricarboxylate transporter receptor subunit TctC
VGTGKLGLVFTALLLAVLVGCTRSAAPPTGAAPASQPADEQAVANFYRGKTVRLLVGFAPGGGYDTYSRLIAHYLGNYIPGNPTVIVDNVPGAGSMVLANQVYNTLPKDGTAIGNISGSLVLEQLFHTDGIEFDATKYRYVAVPIRENYLLFVHSRTGITKLDDVRGPNGKQLTLGGIPSSTVEQSALLMRDGLGLNVKVVSGYEGTSQVRLALENGEVDGFFNSWQSVKVTNPDEVKNGVWNVLADVNDQPTKGLPVKAPTIGEIAQTDEQHQMLRFGVTYPNEFGKVYVIAPEVPAARAAALENAFKKTFEDKDFLTEAENTRLDIDPIFGDDIKKMVTELLGMPEALRTKLQSVMKP